MSEGETVAPMQEERIKMVNVIKREKKERVENKGGEKQL